MRAKTGHRLRDLPHLARRFFWSLRGPEPDSGDEAWLRSLLSPAERELYDAQPTVDRAHSVACAIAAREGLADPTDELIVASALHDVGKAASGLGTFGRVAATVVNAVLPEAIARRWQVKGGGLGHRMTLYARHDHVGADLLRDAGSADVVVAWALEHHQPEDRWSIEPELGRVLLAADG